MRLLIAILVGTFCFSGAYAEANPDAQGYARPVTDPAAVRAATARFQQDLRTLGIAAEIQSCRLTEQLAVGVRGGETAYGAACVMRIGSQPPKELVVCDSDMSGFGALYSGAFVDTPEWMAAFVRNNCF